MLYVNSSLSCPLPAESAFPLGYSGGNLAVVLPFKSSRCLGVQRDGALLRLDLFPFLCPISIPCVEQELSICRACAGAMQGLVNITTFFSLSSQADLGDLRMISSSLQYRQVPPRSFLDTVLLRFSCHKEDVTYLKCSVLAACSGYGYVLNSETLSERPQQCTIS